MSDKIRVRMEYGGKVMLLPSDKDPNVWVNSPDIIFEDGSPASVSDVVEMLGYYGRDIIDPKGSHWKDCRIWFYDDENDLILFDTNGDPIIRMEDGKIRSAAHDCICDRTFPMHFGMRRGGASEYEKFKREVDDSGIFNSYERLIKKKTYVRYGCKTCGKIWTLKCPDQTGFFTWHVDERLGQRGDLKQIQLYDIPVVYNKRTAVLHSDPDRFIFVNSKKITWDNGTPFTPEEIVEFLKYYGRHLKDPDVDKNVSFMDGQTDYLYGYGLSIVFDENGDPGCRIEDGKVLSTYVPCYCEKSYRTNKADYEAFRKRLVESGEFTLLKDKVKFGVSSAYQYKCNKCGKMWYLPADITNYGSQISLINSATYEYHKGRAKQDRKIRGLEIGFIVFVVLLLIGVAILAAMSSQ